MNHRSRIAVLSALAGLPIATSAHAINLSWANLAGGASNVAGNWNPAQVPTAADSAIFSGTGTYTVTFNSGTPQTSTMNFVAGDVTLNVTSPHTTGSFLVGTNTIQAPTATLSSGSITATSISSGTISGATIKTLNIQGSSTSMETTGTGDVTVGGSGIGRTNITGGATVTSADDVIVGASVGSDGILTVSGVTLFPAGRSTLTTSSTTTGDMVVGSAGTGVMNLSSGALASCGHDMIVATTLGSNGTVTVGGTSFARSATIDILRNLNISSNTSATATGTGLFTLNSGGIVTVSGATAVGDSDGGSGTLDLNAGTFRTHDLTVDATNGSLSHTGGSLIIDGGLFTPRGTSLIVSGAIGSSAPLLRFDNGATLSPTITNGLSVANLANREGRLEVLNGSVASLTGAINFNSAAATGSTASGLVQGVGSLLECGSTLTVAGASTATLDIENGARVHAGVTQLAPNVGGQATVTIRDAAAALDAGNSLDIAGGATLAGGTATLNILNTASASTTGPVRIYPGGTVSITNGSLTVGTTINPQGSIVMTNGTITAANFQPQNGSTITASGRIDAIVTGPALPATSPLTLNGPLDAGRSVGGGFVWTTALNVGPHALTVRNTTHARLGDVSINGGSITPFHAAGSSLANGDSLIGTGTINGAIAINGGATVTATGANGLTFNGLVSILAPSTSITITGTKVTFGPSGGFTGAGTISSLVSNQGTITATSTLSLGNGTSFAVDPPGTINVGPHHVTFNDSNGGSVGICTIAGGNLELVGAFAGRLLNTAGGHLLGNGTLTTPLFSNTNGGQISPGSSGSSGAGLLNFTGAYASGDALNPPGTLNIQLGGSTPPTFDRLQSAGNATLGGTLNVSLINGYNPQPGVFHQIVTSTGGFILGDFAIKNMPPRFIVLFSPGGYSVGIPCVADVDNGEGTGTPDGGVTIDDLLYYLAIFEAGSIAADVDDGSSTGTLDGGVTIDDLLYYLLRFENGC